MSALVPAKRPLLTVVGVTLTVVTALTALPGCGGESSKDPSSAEREGASKKEARQELIDRLTDDFLEAIGLLLLGDQTIATDVELTLNHYGRAQDLYEEIADELVDAQNNKLFPKADRLVDTTRRLLVKPRALHSAFADCVLQSGLDACSTEESQFADAQRRLGEEWADLVSAYGSEDTVEKLSDFVRDLPNPSSTSAPADVTLADGATDLAEVRFALANAGVVCMDWNVSTYRAFTGATEYQVATCETTALPSADTQFIGVYVGADVDAYVAALASDPVTDWGIRGSNWAITAAAISAADERANIQFIQMALGAGEFFEDAAVPPPSEFVYEVSGSGQALVTYQLGSSQQQETVTLPWQKDAGITDFLVISAQRQSGDSGTISCRILRRGTPVAAGTSSGPYAVVTCNA